ncbi:MAG: substrate-binding domain-containing protein [Candidatus Colwellbacteria bacterium]|nr:substrate-binding domain-containing protein [Candidatus Colwellbacteria bacterium]
MTDFNLKKVVAIFLTVIAATIVIGAIIYLISGQKPAVTPKEKTIRIGLSMDSLITERWKTDKDLIEKRARDVGATVVTFIANGDDNLQKEQIENLIIQKVDVIIIVPHNGDALMDMVKKAHDAGIKVIAYDRLIKSPYTDLYISFDNEKVGELEAQGIVNVTPRGRYVYLGGAPTDNNSGYLRRGTMDILGPHLRSGVIKIAFDKDIDNWDSEEAYKSLREFLKDDKDIDAVIAANDGIAFGAIRALTEVGLAGKIPVSGQDAELTACQRIVAGTQTMTVFKPIRSIAYRAVELAVSIANGGGTETDSVIEGIPSLLLDPILVDKSNIDSTVIASGFHSRESVYRLN